jgi:glycosyltransferase involved in cell wall biosynthesis
MIEGKLSLVLPAHNEEPNIELVIEEARSTLPRFAHEFEILVVNDGSSDRTSALAHTVAEDDSRIRVIDHPENRGYGAALRSGFTASTGEWVMIMDSDRQFDVGDLVYLEPLVPEHDLVAGYRIQRNDPVHRTVFGKTFRLAMRILFGVQLYDIDCAFKVIRGDLLRALPLQSDGAMISTELMARWARIGATWTQVGVHHHPRTAGEQSGGSIRVILKAIRDVPVLWWKINREFDSEPIVDRGDRAESSPGLSRSQVAVIFTALLATLIAVVLSRTCRGDSRHG